MNTQDLGDCTCDLTVNECDLNCCCDKKCSADDIASFTFCNDQLIAADM